MKNNLRMIIIIAVFGVGLICAAETFAQEPVSQSQPASKNKADSFDYDSAFTNALQMKDLKTSDDYYPAVQSMVDKYGVMFAYGDGKFHAERPLTREQLAAFLDDGLKKLIDLADNAKAANPQLGIGTGELGCNAKPPDSHTLFCSYSPENKVVNIAGSGIFHSFPVMVDSIYEVKDVKQSDAYFAHLQSLTELYRVNLIDSDNNFRASKPVTKKDLYDLLKGVFGYAPNGAPTASGEPVTRGEFIAAFDDALENAAAKIK